MQNLDICEKCPATIWGMKTICKAFDMHIGNVVECPEWLKAKRSHGKYKGKLTTTEMAAMISYKYKAKIQLVSQYEHSNLKVSVECQYCNCTFKAHSFSLLSTARKKCPICKNNFDSLNLNAGEIRRILGIGDVMV